MFSGKPRVLGILIMRKYTIWDTVYIKKWYYVMSVKNHWINAVCIRITEGVGKGSYSNFGSGAKDNGLNYSGDH